MALLTWSFFAMDMKGRGAYLARQLSFPEIEIEKFCVRSVCGQRHIYDQCVTAVREAGYVGSRQQRFFQKLITALKVPDAIAIVEKEIFAGHSIVISIVNTGEAAARHGSHYL